MSAAILLGVLLLPVLPITFTVVGEMDEIGPAFSGAAVGTMMAAGNLGVLLVPLAMEMVAGETAGVPDYRPSLVLLAALGVAALTLITLGVRETGPRSRAPDH
jgi:hypothetical protein